MRPSELLMALTLMRSLDRKQTLSTSVIGFLLQAGLYAYSVLAVVRIDVAPSFAKPSHLSSPTNPTPFGLFSHSFKPLHTRHLQDFSIVNCFLSFVYWTIINYVLLHLIQSSSLHCSLSLLYTPPRHHCDPVPAEPLTER